MVFVDEARIQVKAGDGGKGCESHYRDKFMRHPVPDGGNGGKGGDVVIVASRGLQTLLDYRFKQHYEGERGGHASSKGKKGKTGQDCILRVPIGTMIWNNEDNLLIRDLREEGQSIIVAKGGEGGHGNMHNRPVTPPKPGEVLIIRLELKLIADVGLVGFPNAGKSTIISSISKVKSRIASYPFTTKQPILGIVEGEDFNFICADLPGLIEGAHEGRGLGLQFLKHVERTKIIVHVIDMAGSEGRDPLADYDKINFELSQYSRDLSHKHRILVANKMDLPEAAKHLRRFKRKYKVPIFEVSGLQKTGLDELVNHVREILCHERFPDR